MEDIIMKKSTIFFISISVFLIGIFVGYLIWKKNQPQELFMLMEDTHQLEVGDPVYFRDLVIGRVTRFDIIGSLDDTRTFVAAILTFEGDHLRSLNKGMKFYLVRKHILWGGRAVEVIEEDEGQYIRLKPGDRVFGEPKGMKQLYEWKLLADSLWRASQPARRRLGQRIRDSIATFFTVPPDTTLVAYSDD